MSKIKTVSKGFAKRIIPGWGVVRYGYDIAQEVSAAAGRVANSYAGFWQWLRKKPARETFEQAVARFELNEQDLQNRAGQFMARAAWSFLAMCIAFCLLMLTPVLAGNHPVSHIMLSIGVMIAAGSNCTKWRFRHAQIQQRELFGFAGWFFADTWNRRAMAVLSSMVVLVVLFFSVNASAAEASKSGVDMHFFTPPPNDPSVTYLREFLGSAVDAVVGGSDPSQAGADSPLGRMLGPFNTFALFIGMLFVGYTTIVGTVNSAHDGELLGKKMSELWVPLRTVGGSALLLPFANGFCSVQMIVLGLIIQGVGLGNTVLSAGVDYVAETNMMSRPQLPDSRPLAANILRFETCAAAMNKIYSETNQTTRIVRQETTSTQRNYGEVFTAGNAGLGMVLGVPGAVVGVIKSSIEAGYKVTTFRWMVNDYSVKNPAVCGALQWKESDESSEGNSNTKIAKEPIMLAQAAAVRNMIAELKPTAEKIASFQPAPAGAIEAAAARYESTMLQAAKLAVDQTNDKGRTEFLKYVKEGGWIYLPTYYNQFTQLNDVMQSALNTLPNQQGIDVDGKYVSDTLIGLHDAQIALEEYLKNATYSGMLSNSKMASYANGDPAKEAYNKESEETIGFHGIPTSIDDLKRWISRPVLGAINQFTQEIAGSNLSHVGQIKSVGETIIHTGEIIATMMITVSGGANSNLAKFTVGNFFDAGAALASVSGILSTLVLMILAIGAIAAYYIPMIPYISGITAVIKWFILVAEAIIVAPIWAAAHLHPEGHDVVGSAAPGYMHLFNLFMRPTFVVLGFFLSILLAQPITGFVNATFITAVAGAEHDSFAGVVAFIAYVAIYVLIMTGVVHTVFQLSNWLPDNALRWIGGGASGHGIGDDGKEAEHNFKAGIVNVRHGIGGGKKNEEPGNSLGHGGGDSSKADPREKKEGTTPPTHELLGG